MALTPKICLHKGEGDPIVVIQPFVPMKTFKKLAGYQKKIKEIEDENVDEMFDILSDFAIELFQNKVTKKDLEEYTDFDDLVQIFFKLGEISKGYSPKPKPPTKK